MEDLHEKFNLPSYVKNKSFADASKAIMSRFKGRVDPESKNTEKDLLDRLRQAQEFLKAQEQARQQAIQDKKAIASGQEPQPLQQSINNPADIPSQVPEDESQDVQMQEQAQQGQAEQPIESQEAQQGLMGQIQNACGGMMRKYADGGAIENKTDKYGNIIGASVGALGTATALGTEAFGPTGVDTSGASAVEKKDLLGTTGGGALKGGIAGAQLGNAILPGIGGLVGGGIGALAGAGAGLIGGSRFNKDAQTAQVANTYMQSNKENSQFAYGGTNDPIKPLFKTPGIPEVGYSPKNINLLSDITVPNSKTPFSLNPDSANNTIPQTNKTLPSFAGKQFNPVTGILEPATNDVNSAAPDSNGFMTRQLRKDPGSIFNREMFIKKTPDASTVTPVTSATKATGSKDKFKITDPLEALRYAPAAMNLYQLAKLRKPRQEATERLDTRYKPQYTDENALMNAVREETNAAREAIRQTSGGSPSEARANLLASQLQSMKGLSAASADARERNLQERRTAQQFNLGVDQANLQQANLQQDINDRNIGQYDTLRSRLLASVGDTAGAIGKEELYKKYPEMMGLQYGWRGDYKELSPEEKELVLKAREADKKKRVYKKDGTTTTEPPK